MKRRAHLTNAKQQPARKKQKTSRSKQNQRSKSRKTKPKATPEEQLKWLEEEIDREEEECNKWEKLMQEENKKHLDAKDEEYHEEDEEHPVVVEVKRLRGIKERTEKMMKRMQLRFKALLEGTDQEEIQMRNRDLPKQIEEAKEWIKSGGSDVEVSDDEMEEEFHEAEVMIKDEPVRKSSKTKPKAKPKSKPKPKKPKKPKTQRKKRKRKVSFGKGPNPKVETYVYEAAEYEESEDFLSDEEDPGEIDSDETESEGKDEVPRVSPRIVMEEDDEKQAEIEEKVEAVKPEIVKPKKEKPVIVKAAVVKPKIVKSMAKPKIVKSIAKPTIVKPKIVKPKPLKPKIVKPEVVKPKAMKAKAMKAKAVKPAEVKPKKVKSKAVKPEEVKPKPVKAKAVESKEAKPEPVKNKAVKCKAVHEKAVEPKAVQTKVVEPKEEKPIKTVKLKEAEPQTVKPEVVSPPPPAPQSIEDEIVDEITDEIVDDDTESDPQSNAQSQSNVQAQTKLDPQPEPEAEPEPEPMIVEDSPIKQPKTPEVDETDSENSFMASTSDSARDSDSDMTTDNVKDNDSFLPSKDDSPQPPVEIKPEVTASSADLGDDEIDLGFGMDEDDDEVPEIQHIPISPKSDDLMDEDTTLQPITVDLNLIDPMEDAGMEIEAVTLEPIEGEFDLDDDYGNFENEELSPIITSLDVDEVGVSEPPSLDLGAVEMEYASLKKTQSKDVILAKNLFQSLPMRLLKCEEDQVEEVFLRPAMYLLQYRKFNPYQWYAVYSKTLQFIDELTFPEARLFIAALSKVSQAIMECVKEFKTRYDRNLPNHIYKKSLISNLCHVTSLSLSTGYIMKPTIDGELVDFIQGKKLERKHKINFTRFLCAWIKVLDKYDEFESLLRIILTRFNIDTRIMLLSEVQECLPEMKDQLEFYEHHAELIGTILGHWEHLQQADAKRIQKLKCDLGCDLGHNKIIDRDYLLQKIGNHLTQIHNCASQLSQLKWMDGDALLRSLNQLTYEVELICLSCQGFALHHGFLAVWKYLKGVTRPKPQFFFLRLIAFIYRGILDNQSFAQMKDTNITKDPVEINLYREFPHLFLRVGKATPNNELASCLYCCLLVMREKSLAYELREYKDLQNRKIMKLTRFFPRHEQKIKGSLGFGELDQDMH